VRCYEHGAFTLASGPSPDLCLFHQLPLTEQPSTATFGIRTETKPRRTPRGRAARSGVGATPGPGRPGRALPPTARARARGRARARVRHARGFDPHPGWRNFIDDEWRVLTSQSEALAHIARLVDDEEWRSDKRRSWSAVLRRLVCHMDWDTGLISGLTSQHLAAAGNRAPRTVSRVLAWARDQGLLVVVEPGASAEFLGTDAGRAPTYALVTHQPAPQFFGGDHVDDTPGQTTVDESGDLPTSRVSSKPLTGGVRAGERRPAKWHPYDVPDTPATRNRATLAFLTLLGLGGRQRGKIDIWRARALLKPWWESGANVAGLRHALEHHPERPDRPRGPVTTGARDPLGVIGARLRPWQGRLGEIRAVQIGRMRAVPSGVELSPPGSGAVAGLRDQPAGRGARMAAREALSEHLRELREARAGCDDPRSSAPPAAR
jgi:hypothetical protein